MSMSPERDAAVVLARHRKHWWHVAHEAARDMNLAMARARRELEAELVPRPTEVSRLAARFEMACTVLEILTEDSDEGHIDVGLARNKDAP